MLKRESDGSHKNLARQRFENGRDDDVSPGLARSGTAACRRDSNFKFAASDLYDQYGRRVQPEDHGEFCRIRGELVSFGKRATAQRATFGQGPWAFTAPSNRVPAAFALPRAAPEHARASERARKPPVRG